MDDVFGPVFAIWKGFAIGALAVSPIVAVVLAIVYFV
jgi:hypothetical protein